MSARIIASVVAIAFGMGYAIYQHFKNQNLQAENERLQRQVRRQEVENLKFGKDENFEILQECSICLARPKEILFQPCGHVCACQDCANEILIDGGPKICPICRQNVESCQRVYLS